MKTNFPIRKSTLESFKKMNEVCDMYLKTRPAYKEAYAEGQANLKEKLTARINSYRIETRDKAVIAALNLILHVIDTDDYGVSPVTTAKNKVNMALAAYVFSLKPEKPSKKKEASE
jgi:hypothetical protein